MTTERLLFGVTTSDSASAVDMTADQIVIGIANAVLGMENLKITTSEASSGVQIKKDYIGMATGDKNNRSIVSLEPTRIFIGVAK